MSVFDEILCKLNEISNSYVRSLNDDIKVAFDAIDKFAEEYQNGRGKRDQNQKKALVNTLVSINEDEDERSPKEVGKTKNGPEKRLSNKRSKEQVDGILSPEQEKRPKRNASVKAQTNITKQVNVNLTQKLRRDETDKTSRRKDDDKENTLPILQVKQEKISLPPEPMETEAVLDIPLVPVKQEPNNDGASMPPPAAPVSKPRKVPPKEKSTDSEDESSGKRSARTRNNTETMPPPPVPGPAERAVRASRRGRGSRAPDPAPAAPAPAPAATPAPAPAPAATPAPAPAPAAQPPPPPEPRPKRTRGKKKISDSSTTDAENAQPPVENGVSTPDKPRPKRTRRGKKAAEDEPLKPKDPSPEPELIIPKEERISTTDSRSPAIPQKTVKKTNTDSTVSITSDDSIQSKKGPKKKGAKTKVDKQAVEEPQVICNMNATMTISMDKTVVLTNGVYDHTDGKTTIAMNETLVLHKINRDTMVLDKPQAKIMDSTVVIEKDGATADLTDDLSLLTDDNSDAACTPTKQDTIPEPTSAVKAKVQQFEEMAARTTRTKTRAMAKKDAETENTPPDKIISKQVLSADTLAKMNNMIFNGKTTQISSSATKPTAKLPPAKALPASASKVAAITKAREELLSKDDARKKKEAILEAKKEMQKRKREEKMAAAAAAREAAERERRAALQAQARDRMEKQAHADQGKVEKMKEVERKKHELARKVAETEERRRAEEHARLARLADEQRKADAARRRQQEESDAMKKEAAMMAKQIEKNQREYLEKQKMKQRIEADKFHTPLKNGTKAHPMEPVYMQDGFQYLNSEDDDDDDAPAHFPSPAWCKSRQRQLSLQQKLPVQLVDALFSVRVQHVDLRAIFPAVERAALKRTSSAVWRTPPALQLSRVQESPV